MKRKNFLIGYMTMYPMPLYPIPFYPMPKYTMLVYPKPKYPMPTYPIVIITIITLMLSLIKNSRFMFQAELVKPNCAHKKSETK